MNYTLHQLRVFLEVVRQKSITRAAETMHMTQPALSIQLKNFQQQFDIPLTEVIGRTLFITDFGQSIAEIASSVVAEAEALQYKTREYAGLLTGLLRISSASTGKYVLPYFLSAFMHKHPGVDLVLDVTNKSKVVDALKRNETDFALVSVLPEDIEVHEELLLENRLYLIGNTPSLQSARPFIYREAGSATRMAMDHYLKQDERRKRIELTSNEAVKQALIAGLGYSILSLIGIRNELQYKQLFVIPSKGLPMVTHWRLIWLKGKKMMPAATAYLEFIRKEKEHIARKQFSWLQSFE